jgi:sugar phosphate isomerase/epimerase
MRRRRVIRKEPALARLGIITDEISDDFDHALAVCNELNIRDIELRALWGKSIVDFDADELDRAQKAIDRGGFRVCSIASPFLKVHIRGDDRPAGQTHHASNSTREEQWDVLDRSLAIADRFNAPVVRTFSYWRLDNPFAVRDEIRADLTEATRRVKDAGKLLGLENEHACNIATGGESKWYLDRIPDTALGMIWDPGNEAALGSDPFPGGYEAVKDRIHHVHLKDAVEIGGERFTVMGQGVIPYVDQFRALAADGYDGVLSIETHFALPDGGKEAASRACVEATRALCALAGLSLDD